MSWTFYTTCVSSDGDLISAMTDHPACEEIDYAKFEALVGRELLAHTFPDYDWASNPTGLTLRKDWAVRYYRSYFGPEDANGPCAYIDHSAIEHVFLPDTHPLMTGA